MLVQKSEGKIDKKDREHQRERSGGKISKTLTILKSKTRINTFFPENQTITTTKPYQIPVTKPNKQPQETSQTTQARTQQTTNTIQINHKFQTQSPKSKQ